VTIDAPLYDRQSAVVERGRLDEGHLNSVVRMDDECGLRSVGTSNTYDGRGEGLHRRIVEEQPARIHARDDRLNLLSVHPGDRSIASPTRLPRALLSGTCLGASIRA